jgi:hypothetical protein
VDLQAALARSLGSPVIGSAVGHYTFMKAVPQRHEQWNIDENSVVAFAGISFAFDSPGTKSFSGELK